MAFDRHPLYHSLRLSADTRWASAYRRPRPLTAADMATVIELGIHEGDDATARVIPLFADHEHSSAG
jgi:hypothetical protein